MLLSWPMWQETHGRTHSRSRPLDFSSSSTICSNGTALHKEESKGILPNNGSQNLLRPKFCGLDYLLILLDMGAFNNIFNPKNLWLKDIKYFRANLYLTFLCTSRIVQMFVFPQIHILNLNIQCNYLEARPLGGG